MTTPTREASALDVAAPGDAAALARLHGRCFARGWDAAAIAAFLAASDCVGLVVRAADGEPLGFVLARAAGGEAEILTLAVAPEHRRKGAGERLMRRAREALAAMGAARLLLEVGTGNEAALALYAKLGFDAVGLRPDYYRDRPGAAPEDAVVLSLPLAPRGGRAGGPRL